MRKILNYALYDFANSSFTTIIITFIFSTYFAQQIVKDPILGQSYWGWAIGVSGFAVAIIGPFLGGIILTYFYSQFIFLFLSFLYFLSTHLIFYEKDHNKNSKKTNPPWGKICSLCFLIYLFINTSSFLTIFSALGRHNVGVFFLIIS